MQETTFSASTVKALIFDCDGTLVDSEEAHFLAWQQAMQLFGYALPSEKLVYFVGKSDTAISAILAQEIGTVVSYELLAQKNKCFARVLDKGLPPIQETVKWIHQLIEEKKAHGLKLAVASAALKKEVLKNIKAIGLENAFELVLSGHDDLEDYEDPEGVNKPKPYIYLQAAKLLGVLPSECIAIEDSYTGVKAAVDAGCITVAIPHFFSCNQDLSQATLKLQSLRGLSVSSFLAMAQKAQGKKFNSFLKNHAR